MVDFERRLRAAAMTTPKLFAETAMMDETAPRSESEAPTVAQRSHGPMTPGTGPAVERQKIKRVMKGYAEVPSTKRGSDMNVSVMSVSRPPVLERISMDNVDTL